MDGPLKELAKLEKLTATSSSSKGKTSSIAESLDSLLESLWQTKLQLEHDTLTPQGLTTLSKTVEARKKDVDDRQKEIYNSVGRIGKALDKKFTSTLPSYPSLFSSETSLAAMEKAIALHLLRTGQFETADTFMEESSVQIRPELRDQLFILHDILKSLRNQDIGPALIWAQEHRSFLQDRSSPLEFNLHRSQYIRLLLASHPPNPKPAIAYANTHIRPFFAEHQAEFMRLLSCMAYLPLARLQKSPYSDLASPSLHFDIEPLFAKEYCANLGLSKEVPLRVVGDIGAGGALAKIEKGRRIMRERKSEWSTNELPIEIPIPAENRYHSIFTCPVSKEQSTESNPPMLMPCGHVITRDSLQKLSKPGGRVKCPYCPNEDLASLAIQVYF